MPGYRHMVEEVEADYPSSDDDDIRRKTTGREGPGDWSGTTAPLPAAGQGSRENGPQRLPQGRREAPPVPPRTRGTKPRHSAEDPDDGELLSRGSRQYNAQAYQISRHREAKGDTALHNGQMLAKTDPSRLSSHETGQHGYFDKEPPSESKPFSYRRNTVHFFAGDVVLPVRPFAGAGHHGAAETPSTHTTNLQSQKRSSDYHSDRFAGSYDDTRNADVPGAVSDVTVFPGDVPNHQHEDLADLEFLDNDILLERLQTRFNQQQPYVSVLDCSNKATL